MWDKATAEELYTNAKNYQRGSIHVKKNLTTAIKFLTVAATIGNANAQNDLGALIGNGKVKNKDIYDAVEYFRLAAEQGHSKALTNLGCAYQAGDGVRPNLVEAKFYFEKATEQYEPKAEQLRDEINYGLTPGLSYYPSRFKAKQKPEYIETDTPTPSLQNKFSKLGL